MPFPVFDLTVVKHTLNNRYISVKKGLFPRTNDQFYVLFNNLPYYVFIRNNPVYCFKFRPDKSRYAF